MKKCRYCDTQIDDERFICGACAKILLNFAFTKPEDKAKVTDDVNYYAFLPGDSRDGKHTKIVREPGCMERNIWGKLEKGMLLCKDCGHTYDSKCRCTAVKKMTFEVKEVEDVRNNQET